MGHGLARNRRFHGQDVVGRRAGVPDRQIGGAGFGGRVVARAQACSITRSPTLAVSA
jgi:hypothetical protein